MVGARVYDPVSQRWLEQDPNTFAAGDVNLYRYVSNRPTSLTDPSGEAWYNPVDWYRGARDSVQSAYREVSMVTSYVASNPGQAAQIYSDSVLGTLETAGTTVANTVNTAYRETSMVVSYAYEHRDETWDIVADSTLDTIERGVATAQSVGRDISMIAQFAYNDRQGFLNAAHDGASDGALMVYNAATRGRDTAVNSYVNQIIAQNGAGYAFANAAANVGVTAAYTALQLGATGAISGIASRLLAPLAGCGRVANLTMGFAIGAGTDALVQGGMIAIGAQDSFSVGQMLFSGAMGATTQYLSRACFSGDTKLMARGVWGCGYRRIDEITLDDEVLSRSEDDVNGPLEWKKVEELFNRSSFLLSLHLPNGIVIKTTGEHPFWAYDKGWVPARELVPGDLLSIHDGQWVPVKEVYDTGEYATVYNLRVADFHTYFVGGEDWGFSVWAHNAACIRDANGRWHDELGRFTSAPAGTAQELRAIEKITNALRDHMRLCFKITILPITFDA